MNRGIHFHATSRDAQEFIHELGDPRLIRNREISPQVATELRRQQVKRLKQNMRILRATQEEFNRKMDDYVGNLGRLVESLEAGLAAAGGEAARESGWRTAVSCLGCKHEATFHLEVLFARESDDSLDAPTECYVAEHGELKKGVFRCGTCGSEALRIRAVVAPGAGRGAPASGS